MGESQEFLNGTRVLKAIRSGLTWTPLYTKLVFIRDMDLLMRRVLLMIDSTGLFTYIILLMLMPVFIKLSKHEDDEDD